MFTREGCVVLSQGEPWALLETEGAAQWLVNWLNERPIEIVLLPPEDVRTGRGR